MLNVVYVDHKHIPVDRIISIDEEYNVPIIKWHTGKLTEYSQHKLDHDLNEMLLGDMLLVYVETGHDPMIYYFFNDDMVEFLRQYHTFVNIDTF